MSAYKSEHTRGGSTVGSRPSILNLVIILSFTRLQQRHGQAFVRTHPVMRYRRLRNGTAVLCHHHLPTHISSGPAASMFSHQLKGILRWRSHNSTCGSLRDNNSDGQGTTKGCWLWLSSRLSNRRTDTRGDEVVAPTAIPTQPRNQLLGPALTLCLWDMTVE